MTMLSMYCNSISLMAENHFSESTMYKAVDLIGSETGTAENLEAVYKFMQSKPTEKELLNLLGRMKTRD